MASIIIQTETEMWNTDFFRYDKDYHRLDYRWLLDDSCNSVSDVDCEISNMDNNIVLKLTKHKEKSNG